MLTRIALFFGVLSGAMISALGGWLCYEGKEGWGWFLFTGFFVLIGSINAFTQDIPQNDE